MLRVPTFAGLRDLAVVLATAGLLAGCNRSAPPAQSTSTPPASEPKPAPAPGVRVYISDETGGSVVVVDPDSGQVVERISVGKRPRGIRLSPAGDKLYVALSGSPMAPPGVDESKLPPPDRSADGIGVVDLASHKLVRTYASGQDPESFDVSLDGRTIYISNEETS